MRLLLPLLLISSICFGQNDSIISYSEVVQAPGQTKQQLFAHGREWFNNILDNSKEQLQVSDSSTGELSGHAYYQAVYADTIRGKQRLHGQYFFMKLTIYVKDGRYKYIFTDFRPLNESTNQPYDQALTSGDISPYSQMFVSQKKQNESLKMMKKEIAFSIPALIESLKESMKQKNSEANF